MGREKKWKVSFLLHIILLNMFIKCLPLDKQLSSLTTQNLEVPDLNIVEIGSLENESGDVTIALQANTDLTHAVTDRIITTDEIEYPENHRTESNNTSSLVDLEVNDRHINFTRDSLLRNIRPGQEALRYSVAISLHENSYSAIAMINVELNLGTQDDPIVFNVEGLQINSVKVGFLVPANAQETDFEEDDGIMEIFPEQGALSYLVIIEYTGEYSNGGFGIFRSDFRDNSYIGMNLFPTHARRVFPCMDDPTISAPIFFSFDDVPFNNIVVNSMPQDGSTTDFSALIGPPHLWGMIAHNFIPVAIPSSQVRVFARQNIHTLHSITSLAISDYFNSLEEWMELPYFEIVAEQNNELVIMSLPDTNVEWYALSTVCIWEPNILMEIDHSIKQRSIALVEIAKAMTRQWIGYRIFAENWRHQWVITGLSTYAAYEIAKGFQNNAFGVDITLVDMNTLFTTDVIQESLLMDGYTTLPALDTGEDIFDEGQVRLQIYGHLTKKAPAILRMLRLILGREEDDYIQIATVALLQNRALQTVHNLHFYDSIVGFWRHSDYQLIEDFEEFIEPWVENNGYPVIYVSLRQRILFVTQEHFSFSSNANVQYSIPLTWTTSVNPNYEDENVYNIEMMLLGTHSINNVNIDEEEDYVLFNIQGQGYYRVNYEPALWENIIEALGDPDRRNEIHPLNRATLVDDALNLARANKLDYDIALQVVLTMEHETEYAVWKAFVRNMNFLRKRLVAYVFDEDDLDPDIYLRMVRRTVGLVEDEIGFYPDPSLQEPAMQSLTRGLVMDHACRSNYRPCIAAAVDWFYDPDSSDAVVNPNIPPEIRPAVYCTMVREGDQDVIDALYDRLEIEPSAYERVVILESLACSSDGGFINSLLLETVVADNRYSVEERNKIFAAVAESSYENAGNAISFMSNRASEIRSMYGGPEKLEALIFVLAENAADGDLAFDFQIWVNSVISNLDDSEDAANVALRMVQENLIWEDLFRDYVYEWIDDNDAPTMALSLFLVCITVIVTLFNN